MCLGLARRDHRGRPRLLRGRELQPERRGAWRWRVGVARQRASDRQPVLSSQLEARRCPCLGAPTRLPSQVPTPRLHASWSASVSHLSRARCCSIGFCDLPPFCSPSQQLRHHGSLAPLLIRAPISAYSGEACEAAPARPCGAVSLCLRALAPAVHFSVVRREGLPSLLALSQRNSPSCRVRLGAACSRQSGAPQLDCHASDIWCVSRQCCIRRVPTLWTPPLLCVFDRLFSPLLLRDPEAHYSNIRVAVLGTFFASLVASRLHRIQGCPRSGLPEIDTTTADDKKNTSSSSTFLISVYVRSPDLDEMVVGRSVAQAARSLPFAVVPLNSVRACMMLLSALTPAHTCLRQYAD